MRRTLTILFAAVIGLLFFNPMASAGSPHFVGDISVSRSGNTLTVSGKEAGLGNESQVHIVVSATALCINGGGKHPQAANKETVNAEVSAAGSFEVKNGRVMASLTAGPPSAGDFSCPGGQRLVFASVTYTNIWLTDTTNGVSTSIPDTSRTFFTF